MRIFLSLFLCLGFTTCAIAEDKAPLKAEGVFDENLPSPTVTTVPELDEFLIIPLRIYRLKSTDLEAANCELTDNDFQRIIGKVNRVWAYGGVYFGLESIQEETAATDRLLRLPEKKSEKKPEEKPMKEGDAPAKAADQKVTDQKAADQKEAPAKESEPKVAESKEEDEKSAAKKPKEPGVEKLLESRLYRALIPPKTREFGGFRAYYIHAFDVNGIYYGGRETMIKETARLRKVPGGIDEPIPRVTSHELGHGLTLVHRQDNTNLMASGTTGTTFNEAEVAQARKAAKGLAATIPYTELEKPDAKRSEAEQKQRAEWASDLRAIVKELKK